MGPLCGLLAAAIFLGCTAVAHFLVLLNPSAAAIGWPCDLDGSLAHSAAKWGNAEALQAVLALAPSAALARSQGDDNLGPLLGNCSVMHSAAAGGSLEAVQMLLEVAPELAAAVTDRGLTPLHLAAGSGHAAVVQALLRAAPETVLATADDGELPLHKGAGHVEVVQLLLAAEPSAALAHTADSSTALHFAASTGALASVHTLLQPAPEAILVADDSGQLPLHRAATYMKVCQLDVEVPVVQLHAEVVQLLLTAAPGTALARTADGRTALHLAAFKGAAASVWTLLQAAPEAAGMPDAQGRTPLQGGLGRHDSWLALI